MTLLAKHVPKHRRKLVGLEGQTHFAGPLEDKILGLAHLGDAGEVSLDVSREHRNSRTCKSLSHHLQRDGFSSSGRAGDETMVICKRERQPGWLFALADENLLAGIGHLVIGHSCRIASSRIRVQRCHDYTACCKPIETGQRHLTGWEARFADTRSAGLVRSVDENLNQNLNQGARRDNFSTNFASTLALLQHSTRDCASECGHRL